MGQCQFYMADRTWTSAVITTDKGSRADLLADRKGDKSRLYSGQTKGLVQTLQWTDKETSADLTVDRQRDKCRPHSGQTKGQVLAFRRTIGQVLALRQRLTSILVTGAEKVMLAIQPSTFSFTGKSISPSNLCPQSCITDIVPAIPSPVGSFTAKSTGTTSRTCVLYCLHAHPLFPLSSLNSTRRHPVDTSTAHYTTETSRSRTASTSGPSQSLSQFQAVA